LRTGKDGIKGKYYIGFCWRTFSDPVTALTEANMPEGFAQLHTTGAGAASIGHPWSGASRS